ncbi:GDP-mannose 4,6-dehydratase [Armatimonadota bacterium]|nr:GDP-mannose 4,6-dehydratase [Armatimonadota bacterium]
MRALITGACGFVGSYLVRHLVEAGDTVFGTCLRLQESENTECEYHTLDICDEAQCRAVIATVQPDVIYHLAAITFVPTAEQDFQATLATNVGGTYNLLRACQEAQCKVRFVFVSSSEVYGRIAPKDLPLTEQQPLHPANNYSLTKAMAEMAVQRYHGQAGIQSVIARPFNHTGAGQEAQFVASSFAKQLAQIAKGLLPPVIEVGNLEAKRDFSDVRDIVRAYRLIADRGEGVYNLCSGHSVAIRTLLDTLIAVSGQQVSVQVVAERYRPLDVPEICGDTTRLRNELGWVPRYSLEEALESLYTHWLEKVTL